MNLELGEDQKLLFETVDSAVGRGYAAGGRAEATESERGWNDGVWKTLAEMGIPGLVVAEEHGGAGAGPVEVYASPQALRKHAAAEPLRAGAVLPPVLVTP